MTRAIDDHPPFRPTVSDMSRRTRFEKDRWISACAGLIREGDDRLADRDALQVAASLWERPSIRGFDPDMVATIVLSKRGDRALWGQHARED